MRLLRLAMFGLIGAVMVGCGTTRNNRYHETAYAHDTMYRTPGYGERAYDGDADYANVQPAYQAAPVPPDRVMYDGYYYDRE
jgi:threonine dehydrogenase-like Zn-dependent dehydrogenase